MTRRLRRVATAKELARFPGVFLPGTEDDRALLDAAAAPEEPPSLRLGGKYVEHGLLDADIEAQWKRPIKAETLGNKAWCAGLDWATLVEIDRRLRWCRWRLWIDNFPWDRGPIHLFEDGAAWAYVSDLEPEDRAGPGIDPLDHILTGMLWVSQPWYAAKVLAHYRRANLLSDAAEAGAPFNAEGLAREWMLFGEAWTEAMYVHDHGAKAISGWKQWKSAEQGRDRLPVDRAADIRRRLKRMQILIEQDNNVSAAAEAVACEGLGSSAEANRRLWYRHHSERL